MNHNHLREFQEKINKLGDNRNERSYYPPFSNFLEAELSHLLTPSEISVVVEESHKEVGFPDITVKNRGSVVGWIEVKLPEDDLGNKKFFSQFSKYRDSLENIVFTNFRQWELWRWNREGQSEKIKEMTFDVRSYAPGSEKDISNFLQLFLEGKPYDAKTPKELAKALAKKTKLLSRMVEENFQEEEDSDLYKLKDAFSKTLIQTLSTHQFANLTAETLAYSLFLAALESTRGQEILTLTTAIDFLPKHVPILSDLYSLVVRVSKNIPAILHAAELLIEQLKASDLHKIRQSLTHHKPGDDPVIHFYEPFLSEYDPKERESRGVYYTPKPVVDFIVQGVDHLLKKHFNISEGLADDKVTILDPAAGTGTFLMTAIQQVKDRIDKDYQGAGMAGPKFHDKVKEHVLKNFYGFELLMAPYAVAHLKLTLEIERMGYVFEKDERFQVFLANTLDDPNADKFPPFVGFDSIPQESEAARRVKEEKSILVIIGNPPYSNFGMMNQQPWIQKLLDDYKENLNEKKINLNDDYIKFIRFAQWKIDKTGKGIFAMITANSFLDGITHRQMRESILNTFDEVYIYNLHGNARKGESTPDGNKDENVFNIMTGVSINIFIKLEKSQDCRVFYAEAWGRREEKFDLLKQNFAKVDWQEIDYRRFNQAFLSTRWSNLLGKLNFLVPNARDSADKMVEYGEYWGVQDIFKEYNSGIQTKRDSLCIQFDDEILKKIIKDFDQCDIETIRRKYELPEDGRDWKIDFAKKDLEKSEKKIFLNINYRPFDFRRTIFTGNSKGFIAYPRTQTMKHMLKPNLGLITCRNQEFNTIIFCSQTLIDLRTYSSPGSIGTDYLFPLYLYPDEENILENEHYPNLNPDFMEAFSEKLGRPPSPEEVFYYAYTVFYCPGYRDRYAEQLKIDFPRLPLTGDKKLFQNLVKKGRELVNLHLLGENPLEENSLGSFPAPRQWKVKVGEKRPASNLPWELETVEYHPAEERVYANSNQYFEGITEEMWNFMIGGYQVLEKWLKDRKKVGRHLTAEDLEHYLKTAVSIRETIRMMGEINDLIPHWPMEDGG